VRPSHSEREATHCATCSTPVALLTLELPKPRGQYASLPTRKKLSTIHLTLNKCSFYLVTYLVPCFLLEEGTGPPKLSTCGSLCSFLQSKHVTLEKSKRNANVLSKKCLHLKNYNCDTVSTNYNFFNNKIFLLLSRSL
jgi:hypothetical protein